jgi:hypothetical protein
MSETQAIPEARAPGRYLRNCWYVAGWADDLGDNPIAKTFLDEPVALFRDGGGVRARRVLARRIAEEQEGMRVAAE